MLFKVGSYHILNNGNTIEIITCSNVYELLYYIDEFTEKINTINYSYIIKNPTERKRYEEIKIENIKRNRNNKINKIFKH